MLHLVSEQYGFSVDGMEYGLLSPEIIEQMEREDLDRYHRSILKTSSYYASMDDGSRSNADDAPAYQDELQSKLLVLMDMMDRFSNDLKGLTSQFESGSKPLMTNPQPVSTIYHDEPLIDEVSVVVELPYSEEMKDFDDKKVTGSLNSEEMLHSEEAVASASAIDSQFSVNPSLHKQLTIVESGFKVLSIYCAHMAPKWNSILEMRPKQQNYMSVEDYYNQFFTWRKKLEEVNYIGDEDSYIDDFLYGLKRELAVRVCVYEWKLRTLYGAFRRAEIEETMMKHDAAKVLKEMPQPKSIVNSRGGSLIYDDSKPTHLVLPIFGILDDQHNACKMSDDMPELFLENYLLGIDIEKVSHNLLDERPMLSPVDLSYKDEVLGVSITKSISFPLLGFDPQIFDPGTLSRLKKDYEIQLKPNDCQRHCLNSVLFQVSSSPLNDDQHMLDEMTPVFRTKANGQLMDPYARGISSWHLTWYVPYKSSEMPSSGWQWPQISCDRKYDIGYNYNGAFVLTLLGKVHLASVSGGMKGVDSSHRHFQSAVAPGDWYYLIVLNHFRIINGDSHGLFLLISDSIEHGASFSKSLFEEANLKSLRKLLCCCIFPLGRLTNELDLVNSFSSRISLVSPLRADFAWDPGICVISVHILEDKDVFKRVGNRILVRVMIRSIRDGEIKIRMIRIEKGFDRMMISTPVIFISPANHVLDRQNEVPSLLNKILSLLPSGLQPSFTLFSSFEDYYIDSTLRDALDDAPKVDKMPINEFGESYSSQNRGSGIDHRLFDEKAESFPTKLEICGGPNKYLRPSVAIFLKYLGYEGLASEVSSTKFLSKLKFKLNIKFWLDVISMFGFYPRTGANEGQWNAYKGHVNVQCIVAVPFGIIDHLVIRRPFDPGGCHSPQIDSDHFEFIVSKKVLDVHILDALFLCQNKCLDMDVIGHLRLSYKDAKDEYLQLLEHYREGLAEAYMRDIDGVSHEVMDEFGLTPNAMHFFTTDLEHYTWDPGWFLLVSQPFWQDLGVDFSHLEDKVFARGGRCHKCIDKLSLFRSLYFI